MPSFSMSGDSRGRTLAIFYDDGECTTIPDTHQNFDEIVSLFTSGEASDTEVKELVDTLHAVGQKLTAISERVSVTPYGVFFDGDPLRGELADVILELFKDDKQESFKPLVNFLEKVSTNPSGVSVDSLYRWITNGDLVITPNGDIVAYKGVVYNGEGDAVSIHSGSAVVDGKQVKGQIPNRNGSTIEMPRSKVDADTAVGCSTGLHAGTYSYAKGFARGRVLLVQINPRDIVSVPDDCTYQKLRVSRYVVLSHIDTRLESRVYSEDYAHDEYDKDDSCEFCGDPEYCTGECVEDDYDWENDRACSWPCVHCGESVDDYDDEDEDEERY